MKALQAAATIIDIDFGKNVLEKIELVGRTCLSGSDAAYITLAEIPCVDNLGVDGGNIHSIREFAQLDSLAECAKRLAAVACYL